MVLVGSVVHTDCSLALRITAAAGTEDWPPSVCVLRGAPAGIPRESILAGGMYKLRTQSSLRCPILSWIHRRPARSAYYEHPGACISIGMSRE